MSFNERKISGSQTISILAKHGIELDRMKRILFLIFFILLQRITTRMKKWKKL